MNRRLRLSSLVAVTTMTSLAEAEEILRQHGVEVITIQNPHHFDDRPVTIDESYRKPKRNKKGKHLKDWQ